MPSSGARDVWGGNTYWGMRSWFEREKIERNVPRPSVLKVAPKQQEGKKGSLPPSEQMATFDLSSYAGQSLLLSLEADNDSSNPTSFFVDEVILRICQP